MKKKRKHRICEITHCQGAQTEKLALGVSGWGIVQRGVVDVGAYSGVGAQ